MRTAVFKSFGDPSDVLSLRDIDAPRPRYGEVLVRMLASPINPSDLMFVRGIYGLRPKLPAYPGFEGAGIVEAHGGGLLGNLLKGKRVAVLNRKGGSWADQVVIPARQAVPLSSLLPLEQAAMFFVNPAAAWVMTRHVLKVPRGEWLLQTAAASALGRMVVRLGKHFGFRTCNVVRREDSAAALESIGADGIIVFDPAIHNIDRFTEHVQSMVGSHGVRYAIDPVGGRMGSAVIGCLGIGAIMLMFGTLDTSPLLFSPRQLMTSGASVRGFWLSHHMEQLSLPGRLRLIRTINKLMLRGVLVSETGGSWPLDQVQAAVRTAEMPGRQGKVLLRMTNE